MLYLVVCRALIYYTRYCCTALITTLWLYQILHKDVGTCNQAGHWPDWGQDYTVINSYWHSNCSQKLSKSVTQSSSYKICLVMDIFQKYVWPPLPLTLSLFNHVYKYFVGIHEKHQFMDILDHFLKKHPVFQCRKNSPSLYGHQFDTPPSPNRQWS